MKIRFLLVLISITFIYPGITVQGEMTVDQLNDAQERADAFKERIVLPENLDAESESAAQSSADYVNSEEFKQRIKTRTDQIKEMLYTPTQGKEDDKQTDDKLLPDEKILVFISSSIPEETLRAYAKDIAECDDQNIVMVMRGFIDGMTEMQPTLAFIQKILTKDRDCDYMAGEECDVYETGIEVDPLVFRYFNIQAVPAILYVQNIRLTDPDQSLGKQDNLASKPDTLVIYGDVPLRYVLEKIYDKTKKLQIQRIITKLN